jgi:hypothetical protein
MTYLGPATEASQVGPPKCARASKENVRPVGHNSLITPFFGNFLELWLPYPFAWWKATNR